MKFFIFILFVSTTNSFGATTEGESLPLSSIHFQPGVENWRATTELGFYLLEKTYETNIREFEEFNYQHITSIITFDYGLSNDNSLSLGIHSSHNGRLKKIYDDDTPLSKVQMGYEGLEKVELSFKSRFSQYLSDGIDQSLIMKIQSGVVSAKDKNASIGQTDFFAQYNFSFYLPRNYEFFGSLDIGYIGKKKKRRVDGETENSDTYARMSIDLGLIKRFSRFYIVSDVSFGLTTNYNIKSPSYNITSDKGFFVRGKLGLGYETKKYLIEIFHVTRSDVFNKVLPEDQIPDPTLDYEWESSYTALRVAWLF